VGPRRARGPGRREAAFGGAGGDKSRARCEWRKPCKFSVFPAPCSRRRVAAFEGGTAPQMAIILRTVRPRQRGAIGEGAPKLDPWVVSGGQRSGF